MTPAFPRGPWDPLSRSASLLSATCQGHWGTFRMPTPLTNSVQISGGGTQESASCKASWVVPKCRQDGELTSSRKRALGTIRWGQNFLGHQPKAQEEGPNGEDSVRALISCDPVEFPSHLAQEPSLYSPGRELPGIRHVSPFCAPGYTSPRTWSVSQVSLHPLLPAQWPTWAASGKVSKEH